jgi:error-prone DNA polymerase
VSACGIVTPAPATRHHKGVVFITLEDETGTLNVIVWKSLRETLRAEVLHAGCWRCTAFGSSERKQQRSRVWRCAQPDRPPARDDRPLLGRLGTIAGTSIGCLRATGQNVRIVMLICTNKSFV